MEQPAYPRIKNAVLLCLLLLGVDLAFGLVWGFLMALLGMATESVMYGLGIIASQILSFGLVLWLGLRKTKRPLNEVFKIRNVPLPLWASTIVFAAGFVIVSSEIDNLLNLLVPMPEVYKDLFQGVMVRNDFVLSVLLIGVVPALFEELFFRGLLLDGLSANYSMKKAVFVSALLFGLVHLNPWQFVSAFIVGLFLGWILIKSRSILLCIYVHLFNNLLYLLTLRFKDLLPVPGFNSNYAVPAVFQPLWFDALGICLVLAGLYLMNRHFVKHPGPGRQDPGVRPAENESAFDQHP